MWFKKRKKLDPRIRFQSPSFTKRVQAAQHYKRAAKPFPDTPFGQLLLKLGLDSIWSRVLVVLALVGLVYLVYIPNFFTVRQVEILGLNGEVKDNAIVVAKQFTKKFAFLPHWNLLFLNTTQLGSYVAAHTTGVYQIQKVQKKYPHTVLITASPKVEKYILASPDALTLFFNDGTVSSRRIFSQSEFDASHLYKLTEDFNSVATTEAAYLPEQVRTDIDTLYSQFSAATNLQISSIQIPVVQTDAAPTASGAVSGGIPPSLPNPEPNWRELLVMASKQGTNVFRVIFDSNNVGPATFSKLSLLLGALTPAQQKTLYYIDLRFGEKGYVCFADTACSRPSPPPQPESPEASSVSRPVTTPPTTKK
jgi:hypothetical protein